METIRAATTITVTVIGEFQKDQDTEMRITSAGYSKKPSSSPQKGQPYNLK